MNGSPQTPPTSGTTLIDDFLRRELQVGDPKNVTQVVTALQRRYPSAAKRIDQEAAGLPIQLTEFAEPVAEVVLPATATPATREAQRVTETLSTDLDQLIAEAGNREVLPELRGWRTRITTEYAAGLAAARLAQDPAQRDRAFHSIRTLGDFARVARLVGARRDELFFDFRRLGTSLDDAALSLRIALGESVDGLGLAPGGLILPVSVTEGRTRRGALIDSLRRLSGNTQDDDWPEAAASYLALRDEIGRAGQNELLVYLREETTAPILDQMIGEVSRQDSQSLREVGATSLVDLARMRELLGLINRVNAILPQSTALSAFAQNLGSFLELFGVTAVGLTGRAGARLADFGLPLALAAQQLDDADREGRRRFRDLVAWREEFAVEVDNLFEIPAAPADFVDAQNIVDQLLYDVDRAIDIYAQGQGQPPAWGDEERRAAVWGESVAALGPFPPPLQVNPPPLVVIVNPLLQNHAAIQALAVRFANIRLFEALDVVPAAAVAAIRLDIETQLARNGVAWHAVADSLVVTR